ncbi:hypothetical protein X975_22431, partial [Stegodyphus mimosarum]
MLLKTTWSIRDTVVSLLKVSGIQFCSICFIQCFLHYFLVIPIFI